MNSILHYKAAASAAEGVHWCFYPSRVPALRYLPTDIQVFYISPFQNTIGNSVYAETMAIMVYSKYAELHEYIVMYNQSKALNGNKAVQSVLITILIT